MTDLRRTAIADEGKFTLENLRERVRKTQRQVAIDVGVSDRAVSGWESSAIPKLDSAVGLAKSLGVSLKTICEAIGISVDGVLDDIPQKTP